MKKFPLFNVGINIDASLKNIKEVLESGYVNEGVQVAELTEKLKFSFKTNNLVLTNSCTSALTLAIDAATSFDRNKKHIIVSTPMTCIATNCPITTTNNIVEWCDIDPETGCLSYDKLKNIIDDGNNPVFSKVQRPTAVILVAWAGIPPELDKIYELCKANNIKIILDAAHAYSSLYNGKHIHEWADYTCYSFQAIKHMSTGDGGMIIVKSDGDYDTIKKLKWFGIDRDATKDVNGDWKGQRWETDVPLAGYKFAMNNITAAIGLANVNEMSTIIQKNKTNAKRYSSLFSDCKYMKPLSVPTRSDPSYWVYTVLVNDASIRDDLVERLNKSGIEAGLVHISNDVYTCFNDSKKTLLGVRDFESRQFSLPVGHWLTPDEITYIYTQVNYACHQLLNKKV